VGCGLGPDDGGATPLTVSNRLGSAARPLTSLRTRSITFHAVRDQRDAPARREYRRVHRAPVPLGEYSPLAAPNHGPAPARRLERSKRTPLQVKELARSRRGPPCRDRRGRARSVPMRHGARREFHHELQLLVRAGLTPVVALRAVTSVPARRFGLNDRGRIAEGLRADLVLVDGDLTVTISDTLNITGVWHRGSHAENR
jgi:hypothetical protein